MYISYYINSRIEFSCSLRCHFDMLCTETYVIDKKMPDKTVLGEKHSSSGTGLSFFEIIIKILYSLRNSYSENFRLAST